MENKKFQLAILSLLTLILFAGQGCTPLLYSPSAQAVPVLEEKGHLKMGAELSVPNPLYDLVATGDQANMRLRGTYALSNNFGAHLETSISLDTADYRTYGGLGLGYFSHLEENTFFQLYVTGRKGQVDFNGSDWWGTPFKADYTSIGIQPGVGYEKERYNLGLFTTFKRIDYSNVESSRTVNDLSYLVEPAVGFSYGFGKVSLDAELGISFELAEKTTNQAYFTFGASYNINTRKKARKPARGRGN